MGPAQTGRRRWRWRCRRRRQGWFPSPPLTPCPFCFLPRARALTVGRQERAADNRDDEKGAYAAEPDGKPLDAAAISAEARSAGVRTPKLPEVPPVDGKATTAAGKDEKEKGAPPPAPSSAAQPPKKKGGEEDEFEALAKRFEALKKR